MNPESPQTPREQIEARLTALLLGELSPEEAAEAYRALERDAELAHLHERLKQTIALVREVAASPIEQTASQPAAMQLSESRREQLLQSFKTVPSNEFTPGRRKEIPWFIPMSLAAALVALLASVALLPEFRSGMEKSLAELSSEPPARPRAQRASSDKLADFQEESKSAAEKSSGWAGAGVDVNRPAENREDNGRNDTLSVIPTKNADVISSRRQVESGTSSVTGSESEARNYSLYSIALPPASGPSAPPELASVTGFAAESVPERAKQSVQEINRQLSSPVLPEVHYHRLPLGEVKKDLADQSGKISQPVPSVSAMPTQGLLGSDAQPFSVGPVADRSSSSSSEVNGSTLSRIGTGTASGRLNFSAANGGGDRGLGGGGLGASGGGGGLGGGGLGGGGGGFGGGGAGGFAFPRVDATAASSFGAGGGVASSAPEGSFANSNQPLGERQSQVSQAGETNRFVGRYAYAVTPPPADGAKADTSGFNYMKMDPQMMRRYFPPEGESLEKSRLDLLAQSLPGATPNATTPLNRQQSESEVALTEARKREIPLPGSKSSEGRVATIDGRALANGLVGVDADETRPQSSLSGDRKGTKITPERGSAGNTVMDGTEAKDNKDAVQGRAGGRGANPARARQLGELMKSGEVAQENFGGMPEAAKPNTITAAPAPGSPVVEDPSAAKPHSVAGNSFGLPLDRQLARFYSAPFQNETPATANQDRTTPDINRDGVAFPVNDAPILGDTFRAPPAAKESKSSASPEAVTFEAPHRINEENFRGNAARTGDGKIGVQSGTAPSLPNIVLPKSSIASGPAAAQSDTEAKIVSQDIKGFIPGRITFGDGGVITKSDVTLSYKLSSDSKALTESLNGRTEHYFSKELGLAKRPDAQGPQPGQSLIVGGSGSSRALAVTDNESKPVIAASPETRSINLLTDEAIQNPIAQVITNNLEARSKLKKEELAEQRESVRGGQRGEPMLYEAEEKLRSASAIAQPNLAQDFDALQELDNLQRTRDEVLKRIRQETAGAASTGSGPALITTTLSVAPKNGVVQIVESAKAEPAQAPSLWQRFGRTLKGDSERTARIKIERDTSDLQPLLMGQQTAESFDPYFIQTEFEKIKSKAVLYKVIEKLNLNEAWATKRVARAKLNTNEIYQLLVGLVDVRQAPNSGLVDIRVKSDKPGEAALIANTIAEVYRETREERRQQAALNSTQILKDELAKQEKAIALAREELERRQRNAKIEATDVTPRKAATPPPVPQPEVQTRENPFSTFSLNVSDVSFKLAAASLEKGAMPEPASVRSEEFINAFDYRESEPPPGVPISFAWDRAHYPFAHNRDLLRFSVKTAAEGRQPGRPLNVVLLLDNSGSMERADRVRIIREALRVLAAQLKPEDKLSVIAFARTARLVVDGVPGHQAGQVAEQAGNLTPQGGTNLEDAMNLAYQTALRHYFANGANRVVLFTDGAANLGNVDPGTLKKKVESHRNQGVALDCFGIGWEGYNDDLLEVLSRNGDGRYGFINTPEEASTKFASQLAGALRVAASDVKVQVEFNPQRVTAYRQIGYAKHQLTKEQFRDNTVDAAEIGAAESGNALYAVAVNPRGAGPLAVVRVRYKVPGTTEYHEHEWPVSDSGTAPALEQANASMRLAATTSAFSEWLASSPYAAEVTSDKLLAYLSGVPEVYGADPRPKKLEWMIRQAKSIAGR